MCVKLQGQTILPVGILVHLGYLVAGFIGKRVGNREKTTEEIKVPQSLGFLRDTSVSVFTDHDRFIYCWCTFAGPAFIETKLSGGQKLYCVLANSSNHLCSRSMSCWRSVRMLLAEIVPAFKGIADKAVPNAIPALDCPTVFPFAPNVVVIGFFSSFIAGLISMFFLPLFGSGSIIVPGLVPHFFYGAAGGVFGNATGGRRGAVVGSFANGILISFLPAILLPVLASLGFKGTTFGDSDFSAVGILLSMLIKLFT